MRQRLLLLFTFSYLFSLLQAWADANGTLGDNITWKYVEATKTLTISGTGEMQSSGAPWGAFRTTMTTAIIEEGVTSLGFSLFHGCTGLTSVSMPNSLEVIRNAAFSGCTSISSITIPENVLLISQYAFYQCTSLSSITIPKKVISISSDVFHGCKALASIEVEEGNTVYDSRNNCNAIIETATNSLIYGCMNTVIPEDVKVIGDFSFEGCTGLTSIDIPEGVTTIGAAFSGCTNLTSINIPSSVTSIANSAFNGTGWYNSQPDGLLYLDKCLLGYKGEQPSGNLAISEGVRVIASSAFSSCTGITSINFPSSVTSIGSSAFYGCTGLTSIDIPSSVTSIGSSAFRGCNGIASIIVDKDNPVYDSRENCSALIETASNVLIKGGKNTVIPNSVTSIGSYAFSGCTDLTSISIPSSVTSIGSSAFSGCTGLTSIDIPEGVTSIGSSAFGGCTGLTSIEIPSSVNSIDYSAFNGTGWYNSQPDGLLYLDNWLLGYKNKIPSSSFYVKYGTRGIADYAFLRCNYVDRAVNYVKIPSSVTHIGHAAFSGCLYLYKVDFNNGLKSIGANAFEDSDLSSVDVPSSVTSIGDRAFLGCNSLKSVYIYSPSLDTYGDRAFNSNSDGRKIYVPAKSVDTYKAGWPKYVDDIIGMEEKTEVDHLYIIGNGTENEWASTSEMTWNEANHAFEYVVNNNGESWITFFTQPDVGDWMANRYALGDGSTYAVMDNTYDLVSSPMDGCVVINVPGKILVSVTKDLRMTLMKIGEYEIEVKKLVLCGDHNDWNQNDTMTKGEGDVWTYVMDVSEEEYDILFKLVINSTLWLGNGSSINIDAPSGWVEGQTEGDWNYILKRSSVDCQSIKVTATWNRSLGSLTEGWTLKFEEAIPSGISTVRMDGDEQRANIYNLQGLRLNVLQKGINIVDGKKVLIK